MQKFVITEDVWNEILELIQDMPFRRVMYIIQKVTSTKITEQPANIETTNKDE